MNTSRTTQNPFQKAALRPELKEPLQVRIPSRVKRQFKAHAALLGIEPNELFVEVWQHYKRTHSSAFPSRDE